MLRLTTLTVFMGLVLLAPWNAVAGISGKQIHKNCNSRNAGDRNVCLGYVAGILELSTALNAFRMERICPPKNVTLGQAEKVVKAFLNKHPEHRKEAAIVLVATALSRAFPCNRKK